MLRKSLAVLACLLLANGYAPGLFAQPSTATVAGVILNPSGKPAFGFKVVLKDVASNVQYESEPTDAAGNYSVEVPIGGRYKIDGVVADDGVTRLPVQEVAPVSVLAAGTTRLNVRFVTGASTAPATASTTAEEDEKKKAATPWYKRPGPIVGMVLGSAVIVALAVSGGGGDDPPVASASFPGQ